MSLKGAALAKYLNQNVIWQAKAGQTGYNEPTYSAGVSIKARKEKKRRMVRDAQGIEVVSQTTIYTQSVIGMEDLIDADQVINIGEWIDKDGTVVGYEVFL